MGVSTVWGRVGHDRVDSWILAWGKGDRQAKERGGRIPPGESLWPRSHFYSLFCDPVHHVKRVTNRAGPIFCHALSNDCLVFGATNDEFVVFICHCKKCLHGQTPVERVVVPT